MPGETMNEEQRAAETAGSSGQAPPGLARDPRAVWAALLLALAAALVYWSSPVMQVADSNYGMLLSEQLLVNGNLELDAYFPPHVDSRGYPEVARGETLPRHVHEVKGHLYHKFPAGTSVLSVPFVACARLLGSSTIEANGRFDARAERAIQRVVAAVVTGATVGVLALTAHLLLPLGASLALAAAAAFATQLWSTASRATWSHTWSLLLIALALALVLRWALERGPLRPLLTGTLFALAFFVRPTAALTILPVTLYVFARDRRAGGMLVAAGATWLALFIAQSFTTFGEWLPHYYRRGALLGQGDFAAGLASNLISPSRGLLVLVPVTWPVLWLLVRERQHLRARGLVVALLVAAAAQLLVVSAYDNWWAGASYGPRFSTDLVPHGVVLAALALAAAQQTRGGLARGERLAFAATLLLGVAIHGAGAWSRAGAVWNRVPVAIRQDRMRVFDWSRPQPLCALFPSLLPKEPRTPPPSGSRD